MMAASSRLKSEKQTSQKVRATRVTNKKLPAKNVPVTRNTRLSKRLCNKSSDLSKEQPEGKDKSVTEKKKNNPRKPRTKVKEEGQTSLKVSFLNQVKSQRLRPRRIVKNYHENTTITDESSLVHKVDVDKPKVPIYKSIPLDADPVNNKSEVYDFKYDDADIRQTKTKKKRAKQTVVQKLMKARAKLKLKQEQGEQKLKQKKYEQKYQPVVILERQDVEHIKPSNSIDQPDTISEGVLEDLPDTHDDKIPSVTLNIENSQMQREMQHNIPPLTRNIQRRKPIMISVESLTDKKVKVMHNPASLAKNTSTSLKPNITINNCSLLEKSLSPIVKPAETFDFGSPWRAPPVLGFSRIRNLYQSTPQNNRMKVLVGNLQRGPAESKNRLNSVKEKEAIEKVNDKVDAEKSLTASGYKKKSTSGRKFGTEITNIDHSAHAEHSLTDISVQKVSDKVDSENSSTVSNQKKKSTSGRKFGTEITNIDHSAHAEYSLTDASERVPAESELLDHSIGTDKTNVLSTQRLDSGDDKENNAISNDTTVLNCPTPKKNLQRKNRKLQVHNLLREGQDAVSTIERKKTNLGLKRAGTRKSSTIDENFNPIPGPSGLQKKQEFDEEMQPKTNICGTTGKERDNGKVLRQLNLNNFLNLADMPETTIIKTSHGIFDDIQSPPISSKSAANHEEICDDPKVDLKNAFGFNEIDASSTSDCNFDKENKINNRVKTDTRKTIAPARLSVGQIRNYLTPQTLKESKIPNDIASFSDTFDILSEAGELSTDKVDIPLFTDPEPSHFIEPPKHSYKRKRQIRFSFSEDSDDADESNHPEIMTKRRKKKLSSKDEKRMEAWVNDVNRTFEEIDQYDLIVE